MTKGHLSPELKEELEAFDELINNIWGSKSTSRVAVIRRATALIMHSRWNEKDPNAWKDDPWEMIDDSGRKSKESEERVVRQYDVELQVGLTITIEGSKGIKDIVDELKYTFDVAEADEDDASIVDEEIRGMEIIDCRSDLIEV